VHVHEHGEEELDAVSIGPCPELTLDVRHALSPSLLDLSGARRRWRVRPTAVYLR
jgi:hypothetical protein